MNTDLKQTQSTAAVANSLMELKMDQRKTKLFWIIQIAQLIGIIFAGIGLLLNYYQFKEEFEYRKQEFAYKKREATQAIITSAPDLIAKYNKPLKRNVVLKRILLKTNYHQITEEEAQLLSKTIIIKGDSSTFTRDDKEAAMNMLNYLESLCSIYTNDIGNKGMFEESFKIVIMQNYNFFEKFIEAMEKNNNVKEGTAWKPLRIFVNTMNLQDAEKQEADKKQDTQ